MNKKIILGLGVTALLTSTLLAMPAQCNMQQMNKSECNKQKMMKSKHHKGNHDFAKIFMKLDLNEKQKAQIRDIVQKNLNTIANPSLAFTDSSFDKTLFVKLEKQKRDDNIQRRANMIEEMYAVLNSSQKKDFKTMLDMREIMKKNKRMKFINR